MNGKRKIFPLTEEQVGIWKIYLQTNWHHRQLNPICSVCLALKILIKPLVCGKGLDVFLANKHESEDMQQTVRVTPDPWDRSATLAWNLPMHCIPSHDRESRNLPSTICTVRAPKISLHHHCKFRSKATPHTVCMHYNIQLDPPDHGKIFLL